METSSREVGMLKDMMFWPEAPYLSLVAWLFVMVVLLYFARTPAHQALRAMSRIVHSAMRLASRSVLKAEASLRERNRQVLLAAGAEAVERGTEREFHRVGLTVERDLQCYPALHRSLSDLVVRIDEDYRESTESPPSPPGWVQAVEAVAKIPSKGDGMVSRILEDIKKTLDDHHKEAMVEYRKASRKRHGLLRRMMPYWRKLRDTLEDVGKTITGLEERAQVIDRHMEEYRHIRAGTDRAERSLSSSAMVQFVISAFVLAIAAGGAFINFNLIALPMSEMVGGGIYVAGFKVSYVAALVIILVEATMGLFLMESLRITRLFPVIGALDDKIRVRMIWISFAILLTLAGVESALAFMRDRIAQDMQALRQTLAGVEHAELQSSNWIPTVGQMVMGFVLPFALTFVAIPLESFVHSSRIVLGGLLRMLLRGLAFVLRFLGLLFHYLGEFLISTYDLVIFVPLWVERLVRARGAEARQTHKEVTS
jgi:hypothetical protein